MDSKFSSTSIRVAELNGYFDSLCGGATNIAQIIPANFGGSGQSDFAVMMYCNNFGKGALLTPTVDRLVLIKRQNDGSYKDATTELLGVSTASLGGISTTYVKKDFNRDGYDDIVFAVNWEDGRTYNEAGDGAKTQNTFLTSKGDGTYGLSRLGTVAWNYQVHPVDNGLGGFDVLSLPIGSNPKANLYRLSGTIWNVVNENWTDNVFAGADTIPLSKNNGFTTYPLVISASNNDNVGLNLYHKPNGTWTNINSYILGQSTNVPWTGWNGQLGTVKYMKYEGKDYVSMSFEKMCETRLGSSSGSTVAIVAMTAREVVDGYYGQALSESSHTQLSHVTKLMIFDVSAGSFRRINSLDLKGSIQIATHGFECRDANGDGFSDLLIQNFTYTNSKPTPIVLLGDGVGGFKLVDSSVFPATLKFSNTAAGYIFSDLTGDGISDYLDYPVGGIKPYLSGDKLMIILNRGLSNLNR